MEATKSTSAPAADEREVLLEATDVTHHFGARRVLDGLTLQVARGECVGLLGPNGSGKSTALRLLAGQLPLQQGSVRFAGVEVTGPTRRLLTELGMVFQRPALDEGLTLRQNLLLSAQLYGIRGGRAREAADEQLELAGLRERADEAVKTLSGGMKRRLDLARALLHRPQLLLLDEPSAGLDELSFRQLWRRLESMRRAQNTTIVVATHRPEEAMGCDRLVVISEGRPAVVDTPEALCRQVASDAVIVEPEPPQTLDGLARELRDGLGLDSRHDGRQLVIECERGHELIPRLVESVGATRLASVSLRRPTLADVFLKLTGRALDGPETDGSDAASRGRRAR